MLYNKETINCGEKVQYLLLKEIVKCKIHITPDIYNKFPKYLKEQYDIVTILK
jgi:hypothetical protein